MDTDRWNELFEMANKERPLDRMTIEEQIEYRSICQTLAAIDRSWQIDGEPATLEQVREAFRNES